jgi:APA family basic amino acid/polyamine antiporter/amino acid efflux transporter
MPLKKTIGKKALLLIAINAILGTGIFFLPAIGAMYAGPASLLSWIIMAFVALFISMYFAELISMFPKSGGVYEYIKKAFGEFYSFIFGWTAWIVANITIAMLIVGSLIYLLPNLSLTFSIIISFFLIILFNYVSYRGMGISAKLLLFFGVMTVLTLLILIIPGIPQVDISRFDPFIVFPVPFIFLAIYFIAETFFGWETATYLSEEVKTARKILPKALVIATAIISLISILLVFVSIGVVGWETLSEQDAPLVFLSSKLFGTDFSKIFAIIIFIPLIGTAAGWIISSPRLLFAMSRDKVLVPRFRRIHKKYRTPHNAILFQTIVTCFVTLIGFASYIILLSLLLPLVLILYSAVMLSVVKLRITKPNIKRYYKAPLPRAGPIFIIMFNIFLLLVWLTQITDALAIFLLGLILIFFGIPLYIIIKLQTDVRFTEKFFDKMSTTWDKLFPIWYGRNEINKVIGKLKLKKDNIVLDFGCGSGITTYEISKKVKDGTVIAVDLSEKQMERAIKKTGALKLPNVIFIKESKMKLRENFFDAVSAVGVLEHIEDPRQTIKTLIKLLRRGGRFSFMSFGRSLGIPAPEFLANEKTIRSLFKGLGVKIQIKKEKKKLTEYWYIWGEKR